MPDNAIYQLAEALLKIKAYTFPVKFTDTTRVDFEPRAPSATTRPARR